MKAIRIYHNPKCSKSRETLELLRSRGMEPEIIEYLKTPPTETELDSVLLALRMEPPQIVRVKEKAYAELGLADKPLSRAEWLRVLAQNPVLIERPVVIADGKAVIGRPPENVLRLFS